MIDMHYDLLSILYYAYLKNDFSYVEEIKDYFNNNNIKGVIANLYFMSKEEMYEEIGNKEINVEEMFAVSVSLFKKYFPKTKVIFSIEGCDYIRDTKQLERLKKLGLESILLVWNNKNKYGSGPRSEDGLTKAGREFLLKAIELDLIIDLSHMNKRTFYDTVSLLQEEKEKGKNIKVIVSHSNCFELCDIPRNITDEQIKLLKDLDVVMGLVSYSYFLTKYNKSNSELKELYVEHIKHVVDILGIDSVGVSTDDMSFDQVLFGHEISEVVFPHQNIKNELSRLLEMYYNKEDVKKILYKNVERKLFN